ncbi:hypothetical protein GOP47_0021165 [Adiantum capillus-veneris]|uniref:Uncharacterized protein n=1 Tax=Adiantum capillus-veneris TaxID=13818 RepID=A0A9D4Z880_ADICA|nr:hypothetical protein GOP47_0021165 [Adiantum capillus-veneris]
MQKRGRPSVAPSRRAASERVTGAAAHRYTVQEGVACGGSATRTRRETGLEGAHGTEEKRIIRGVQSQAKDGGLITERPRGRLQSRERCRGEEGSQLWVGIRRWLVGVAEGNYRGHSLQKHRG